jgi:hypothetical protein
METLQHQRKAPGRGVISLRFSRNFFRVALSNSLVMSGIAWSEGPAD